MKRTLRAALLCTALLLGGCTRKASVVAIEETPPAPTVSPDGNPHDVTCFGSYTGTGSEKTIVARVADASLTNEELQVWYWAEVAQYRQSQCTPAPDFSLPLDTQPCPLDDSVNNWQQYFLKAALNRWHTAAALIRHSQEVPPVLEDAYRYDRSKLEEYMNGMPAAKQLYGYNLHYSPNSLHQSYLDGLEERLSGPALNMTRTLNYAYMYFSTLSYGLEAEEPVSPAITQPLVSFRQILLCKDAHKTLSECFGQAQTLLSEWLTDKDASSDTFAQLASQHSQDPGSAGNGGLYENIRRDQLPEELAAWCFDENRLEGDTAAILTDCGVHILYFLKFEDASIPHDRMALQQAAQQALLTGIREEFPLDAEYHAIVLSGSPSDISVSDLLYPDIAHERFPEVPLYLQQNYPDTKYGEYPITTNGCGITTLAMIASYLADEEWTPPEMCARFGRYSCQTGTDGSLFEDAPPQLGFYLLKKTYDWREARDYMEEGHPVVVCQYRGYWTSGGHYLVLEKLTEEGLVQVRDSNIYNYRKLIRHKDDCFHWDTINLAGQGYWIFAKKFTASAACTRCGDPDAMDVVTVRDYLCEKCETALTRRNAYLSFSLN